MVIAGIEPDPNNAKKISKWAKDYWSALHPHNPGGGYVNFMMGDEEGGEARLRATYGPNYDRLAQIKAKYDPDNLFRVNQNIKPARVGAGAK
jgi:FAD/FMN-containing dehydrogenase